MSTKRHGLLKKPILKASPYTLVISSCLPTDYLCFTRPRPTSDYWSGRPPTHNHGQLASLPWRSPLHCRYACGSIPATRQVGGRHKEATINALTAQLCMVQYNLGSVLPLRQCTIIVPLLESAAVGNLQRSCFQPPVVHINIFYVN